MFEKERAVAEREWRQQGNYACCHFLDFYPDLDCYLSSREQYESDARRLTTHWHNARLQLLLANPLPLPTDIRYSPANSNFYHMTTNKGQGHEFYNMWRHRVSEFPSDGKTW